ARCNIFESYLFFGDKVRQDEVPQKFLRAHAFHFPSAAESFSLAACEALATNRFVIASRRVGLIEYLEEEFGAGQLRAFGVFICDTFEESVAAIHEIHRRLRSGLLPSTRALLTRSTTLDIFET